MNEIIGCGSGKEQFPPGRRYNVDETCFSVNPKSNHNILSQKGQRRVGQLTTTDRGKTVTVTLCVLAAGIRLPPLFIFARKKMQQKLIAGTMDGTGRRVSEKGWMTAELFSEWFRWFIDYTKPTPSSPVLLVLDSHASHTKNIEVSILAVEKNVVLACLPPHCTHRLQPLDVNIMKPLSDAYSAIINHEMRAGERLVEEDIACIVSRAFESSATKKNIQSGLPATGICPSKRHIFHSTDFAPAELSNQPRSGSEEEDVVEHLIRSMNAILLENQFELIAALPQMRNSPIHLPLDGEAENEHTIPPISTSSAPPAVSLSRAIIPPTCPSTITSTGVVNCS